MNNQWPDRAWSRAIRYRVHQGYNCAMVQNESGEKIRLCEFREAWPRDRARDFYEAWSWMTRGLIWDDEQRLPYYALKMALGASGLKDAWLHMMIAQSLGEGSLRDEGFVYARVVSEELGIRLECAEIIGALVRDTTECSSSSSFP